MSDDRLSFSCILPTYNRCDVVEQTLLQLLACDYPDDRYEILVADNSSDGTPDMVERVARARRRFRSTCCAAPNGSPPSSATTPCAPRAATTSCS